MDIMNLQNFLVNQAPISAFAGKNSAPVRQPQQKADSFASKLNNAVERSANGTSGNEVAQPPADMEKPMVFNGENSVINDTKPKQAAEDSRTDVPNAIDGEQPLVNVKPEIPDEFLGAASLTAQMPPAANIIDENTAVQFSTSQDNFFLNLSERPDLSLTAEDLKSLSPETAKILENVLSDANVSDKGQITSQAAANELLVAAKQDQDVLAAKGELPKIAEAEPEIVLRQSADTAKQLQVPLQSANPATELTKPAVEITNLTVIDATKTTVEIARPNEQPTAGEATSLTRKEPAEQNLANRQDTAGQQSFDQTMESRAEQIKNPDQPLNNNQTFAVSFDTATQSTADKPDATQTQQTASDFTTPRDEFQIKEQIIQQATLINRSAQESEMIIRLKPEHLGELALKVTVNNGVVSASFHSNNAEVRGILENSIQQLKNDLANAGFKVDNVSISAGLSQFAADQERAMQWQQQQTRRGSGKKGEEGYAEAVEGVSASQQVINASKDAGVDYRI